MYSIAAVRLVKSWFLLRLLSWAIVFALILAVYLVRWLRNRFSQASEHSSAELENHAKTPKSPQLPVVGAKTVSTEVSDTKRKGY